MAKQKRLTPARRKRLERRFNEALRHHQSGDLEAAEKAYRRLLEADPGHCFGLHYLGLILRQRGQCNEAIGLLQRASLSDQADAMLMINLGCMLCDAGRREESLPVFRRGVELEPGNLMAQLNYAGLLLESGQADEAGRHFQAALDIEPGNANALAGSGRVALAAGAVDEAVGLLRSALEHDPRNLDALVHLATALVAADEVNEAFEFANRAVELAPGEIKALLCLGSVQMTLERYDLAQNTFREILELSPGNPYAYGELIHALVDAKREEEALEVCSEAFRVIPDFATGYANQGNALKQLGRLEEAIAAYQKSIDIDPGNEAAYNNMGMTYMDLGDMPGARRSFEKALAISPTSPEPLFNLSRMKLSSRGDVDIIGRLENLISDGALALRERVSAHYALGKSYDDCHDYEKAFRHYQQANDLKRRTVKFMPDRFQDWVRHFASTYTRDFFERCRGFGVDSERPIFIVGMPRSGTTLVEQIISSHPRVHGADELTFMSEIADSLQERLGAEPYPRSAAGLTAPVAQEMALDYLRRLAELNATTDRVTDKMPSNYYHLGLIAVMFPRCHIIHCQRNPMDACFSNFIQLFGTGHFYSYSLDDIAVYYRAYETLMQHWREVLPLPIHEVCYEELVEDQERVSRDLIAHLGLEWDPACLTFHQNRRTVRTASHWQVRQPIYKSARQRWKNYAPYLEKLRRDIGYEDCAREHPAGPGAGADQQGAMS